MNDNFNYENENWNKIHKVTDFNEGDLVLVSTMKTNNIKGPKKPKNSYVGPFVLIVLHGTNEGQREFSGELKNKHPTFPVSLIKPYKQADKEFLFFKEPGSFSFTTSGTE
ncbi:hypothetical protein O181_047664 [Austropuccinia psidii MF-1]|uniref:Uncharacterized protein n=1 Tax=Austropuccinia psidii MF-1 TaxID=1389203 RepID=A0A9Q3DR95_9BASI|nr:hypothetical protein [Austropuccinia psidii MF-1]